MVIGEATGPVTNFSVCPQFGRVVSVTNFIPFDQHGKVKARDRELRLAVPGPFLVLLTYC